MVLPLAQEESRAMEKATLLGRNHREENPIPRRRRILLVSCETCSVPAQVYGEDNCKS